MYPGSSGSFSSVQTRSGFGRMDAITALASWPKSIDEIAHAVADPDSPPTAAQIREVARAIGDGDVHIIVNGDRTNLRLTQHVILRYLLLGYDGSSAKAIHFPKNLRR